MAVSLSRPKGFVIELKAADLVNETNNVTAAKALVWI
jgi:hypothetical protein